jgi:heptosyltransferase-2
MRWSGARYRRAYASPFIRAHLTHPLGYPGESALRNLNVVDLTLPLGWPAAGRAYGKHLGVTEADRAFAASALPGEALRIGLYFGARQRAKLWPPAAVERLAKLILADHPQAQLVLLGDPTDRERARALADSLDADSKARVGDFTGRTTFGQAGALMQRCRAVVSTDSGPMHMADALGVPLVALFSSHNHPAIWRPTSARAIAIHHEIECGPCFLAECPVGNRCMANITPEEVYAALRERLAA